MNIKEILMQTNACDKHFYFNDIEVKPEKIKAILINEIVPKNPKDDFYGSKNAEYLATTIPLFQKADLNVKTTEDILDLGIYITNAVKAPKNQSKIERQSILESLPFLEKELSLFPNVQVIMLMGDIAKTAMNMIAKKETSKNIIPKISTYKLRHSEIKYKNIHLLPSYIMTGKNILIEKSKFEMASEDIKYMYEIITK